MFVLDSNEGDYSSTMEKSTMNMCFILKMVFEFLAKHFDMKLEQLTGSSKSGMTNVSIH